MAAPTYAAKGDDLVEVELVENWADTRRLFAGRTTDIRTTGSTPDDETAFAVIQGVPAEPLTVCAVRPHKRFEDPSYAECRALPKPSSDDATLSVTFDPPPQ